MRFTHRAVILKIFLIRILFTRDVYFVEKIGFQFRVEPAFSITKVNSRGGRVNNPSLVGYFYILYQIAVAKNSK